MSTARAGGNAGTQVFPMPPVEPMLATLAESLPAEGEFLFEPKWDGFRAIVYRGASELYTQSRDLKPLDRYFPELHEALLARLPEGCVVDGEIVIAGPRGLDFDALQLRLARVKSAGSQLGSSSHVIGADTRASGLGRTE